MVGVLPLWELKTKVAKYFFKGQHFRHRSSSFADIFFSSKCQPIKSSRADFPFHFMAMVWEIFSPEGFLSMLPCILSHLSHVWFFATHGLQPTRVLCSGDSPGRIVFVVKVAESCPTLCDPMDYTVCGILQARMLEWVAIPFSSGSSQPKDRTQGSCIVGRVLLSEPPEKPKRKAATRCNAKAILAL